jgi:aminopeptidase N
VARSLAEHRARTISDLTYSIRLDIPDDRETEITGSVGARFQLEASGEPLVLDFAAPADRVHSVVVNQRVVQAQVVDEHLIIPSWAVVPGANHLAVHFTAGDGPLNRADEFLYTLFVPDRARFALPIFDQPDLKARYQLTLVVPSSWSAVANGPLAGRKEVDGRTRFYFAETQPISTYVFAFAAGRFDVVTAERGGRQMRLFHRETDTAKVERNLEAIFDLHGAALAWLEEYTGIPYPFDKLDFVAAPSFQYGGMEHAGAVFYRDRSLFLDETATQNQYLGRASLIAHEVAHMWFGNLVTMEWFNDVWMKEVFANFMAAKIVNPSFPEVDHELRFLLAHYPAAYEVDRTAGANPIRQDLENLNEAGTLYGAIIYQKAPIVMRHLERLMGEGPFRDGLREYLSAHRYANASWPGLVEVLDRRTDEDLVEWSRVWVTEPGRPMIEARVAPSSVTVTQRDPADRGRAWNQRLEVVAGYAGGKTKSAPAHLRESTVDIDLGSGSEAPLWLLANGGGYGYGYFVLDDRSRSHLLERLPTIDDSRLRAVAWLSLWDALLDERLEPAAFIDLTMRALPLETDELTIQRLLGYLDETFWRFLRDTERTELAPAIEALLWQQLEAAERSTLKGTYLRTYQDLVLTDDGIGRLQRLWSGELQIRDLQLSENDTIALAQAIAVRGVADAEKLLDAQRSRIENPDTTLRFDFVRPALSADRTTRDAFFASLADEAHRERERWVLEALSFLHHPLRAADSEPYIRPSLDLLEEIQRTGDIFFPLGWLSATLDGHNTASAAEVVRQFLNESPGLPHRLRGKLLQAADPLFRAARIVDHRPEP